MLCIPNQLPGDAAALSSPALVPEEQNWLLPPVTRPYRPRGKQIRGVCALPGVSPAETKVLAVKRKALEGFLNQLLHTSGTRTHGPGCVDGP